jgi:hypothetical protein
MHWLDPAYLPEVSGALKQFLVNPRGEIDGLILKDGTEVHFPPHMSSQIEKAITIGKKVKVRGVRPRNSDVIAGVSLQAEKGDWIVDDGPPKEKGRKIKGKDREKPETMPGNASGVVQRALHGPKGEVRGVLLETGETIRFPKHEDSKIASLTKPGSTFATHGEAVVTRYGTVLDAYKIGPSEEKLRKIRPRGPKHEKPRKHAH